MPCALASQTAANAGAAPKAGPIAKPRAFARAGSLRNIVAQIKEKADDIGPAQHLAVTRDMYDEDVFALSTVKSEHFNGAPPPRLDPSGLPPPRCPPSSRPLGCHP